MVMDGDHGHGYVVVKMVMVKFITLEIGGQDGHDHDHVVVKMVRVKIMTMVDVCDVPSSDGW